MLELLTMLFSTTYLLLNYYSYKNVIYPAFLKYYREPSSQYNGIQLKEQFLSMFMWMASVLFMLILWTVFMFLIHVTEMLGTSPGVILVSAFACIISFLIYALATIWPKQIGSRVTGIKWSTL